MIGSLFFVFATNTHSFMKGVDLKMILITILAFILILLIAITIGAIVIGGAGFIVIFSDVIVCATIIGWIIYKLVRKQKE